MQASIVEGDSELAVLLRRPELYDLVGIDPESVKDITVVSCAGKWTILPIARLMRLSEIPLRIIHDWDRKNKNEEELKQLPAIHPYNVNSRILDIVDAAQVWVIDDTLEDVLWPEGDRPSSSGDKPFRAWKRVGELCDGKDNLDHAPELRDLVRFALGPE